MTQAPLSRGRSHFERIYASAEDPWNFRSSKYEREKYDATIAALPRPKFQAGLEVGCSIGELTRLLAERCESLLGVDTVAAPLKIAGARCAGLPHVRFAQMHVPATWPEGLFDLVVLSEVLYFLTPNDISALAARVNASLRNEAVVVLVNWLGRTDDPCSGDEAAERFIASLPKLRTGLQRRQSRYRIDVLIR
jgi:cyclopropane fatty-acyl-phospholipid synthase-like methyltransferase